jgi:hypothetical protein
MNKITFHSNKHYNDTETAPCPTAKVIPKWWHDADIYIKDFYGNPVSNANKDGGKMLNFKACPAMLDTFTTGYTLVTPCDIEFYEKNNRIKAKVPLKFDDFVGERPASDGFQVPFGYDKNHFHWYANWAPQLPEGYSSLYVQPINHFDLPWLTVGGIIDSDKVTTSGLIPFFIQNGFTGVVPAGTPYLQIIPFKREDWESDFIFHKPIDIMQKAMKTSETFRTPEGGVYKKKFWTRRRYK